MLEHINNIDTVLAAAYSLLTPGGEMHVYLDSLGSIADEILIAKHKSDHNVYQYFDWGRRGRYLRQRALKLWNLER